jgi:hypothetical protein
VLQKISPSWAGNGCIVAAPGPSLSPQVAKRVRFARWLEGWKVIVVNDAYKLIPYADILYAADNRWWELHQKCEGFFGQLWACHEQSPHEQHTNDKRELAARLGLNLVRGRDGDEFSFDPEFIRYGSNSGFQAINLALLFGCKRIVLVGFDMRRVDGKAHFFGNHPAPLRDTEERGYAGFVRHFERAAKKLPPDISIVNATPWSALRCFPMATLEEAIGANPAGPDSVPDWYRPEPDERADRDSAA